MKRTAKFGNSIGEIVVTLEGYGKLKNEDYNSFANWMEHQADVAAGLLVDIFGQLGLMTPGETNRGRRVFEFEDRGTIVGAIIELKLWKWLDRKQVDAILDALVESMKLHYQMHLDKPDFDETAFESWANDLPFGRMDGGESLLDTAARFAGLGDLADLLAGLTGGRMKTPFGAFGLDLGGMPGESGFPGGYRHSSFDS